jgi:hypothetical protein
MNAYARKTAFTLLASLALIFLVSVSSAAQPNALLLSPGHDNCLPTFGFASFNIAGVGERVTYVRWGGLASRLGLEPGDTILRMNGFRLNYHGSWNDALHSAVANGGYVQLMIRDVRSGYIAYRETYVGGSGPIVGPVTPHFGGNHGPVVHYRRHGGSPTGPVTPHSHNGGNDVNQTIKQIARLFD